MTTPSEIRISNDRKILALSFPDGSQFQLSAELLRVLSPSAEVQGHGVGQKITVHGKANVTITQVEPIGNYAIRIIFSDGHATGLFSWTYLLKLCQKKAELWQAYLEELETKSLRRGP